MVQDNSYMLMAIFTEGIGPTIWLTVIITLIAIGQGEYIHSGGGTYKGAWLNDQ